MEMGISLWKWGLPVSIREFKKTLITVLIQGLPYGNEDTKITT
jgi:hypothetical protein